MRDRERAQRPEQQKEQGRQLVQQGQVSETPGPERGPARVPVLVWQSRPLPRHHRRH